MSNYNENSITIINTSYHKNMTDSHLAQVNFTAVMPQELWGKYNIATSKSGKKSLGRIRFMETTPIFIDNNRVEIDKGRQVLVFGRVSHGYGYGIEQDIYNAIEYTGGKK